MRSPPRFAPGPITKSRGREEPVRPIAAGLKLDEAHVDSIEQSHQRCVALGVSRIELPDLTPLGHSDLAVARERNLPLHDHAAAVVAMLHAHSRPPHSTALPTAAPDTPIQPMRSTSMRKPHGPTLCRNGLEVSTMMA